MYCLFSDFGLVSTINLDSSSDIDSDSVQNLHNSLLVPFTSTYNEILYLLHRSLTIYHDPVLDSIPEEPVWFFFSCMDIEDGMATNCDSIECIICERTSAPALNQLAHFVYPTPALALRSD
ncbi:hypothetical protein EVAR_88315_1 [Eumeta japonica]|uniref:Uncharacterized protein n=1 Tax=Eumeta variegata TaxID=151549 RepID=A0A4C1VMA8_EUMVA|nr:hypothetical protein EVAR_88315_1 [Eumeta japonica]